MYITMSVDRPQDVQLKLETTMTVSQWQKLSDSLGEALSQPGKWHGDVSAFRNALERAIRTMKEVAKTDSQPLMD